MAKRVVILEDDKTLALIYKMFLKELGYQIVEFFDNAEKAFAYAGKFNPDIALVDISLSGKMQGIEAATILQSEFKIPVIYITGHTEDDIVQKAIQSNTYGYLIKPVDKDMLHISIELALSKFKSENEKNIEKQAVDQIDIGILVSSQDGEFLFANEAAKRLLSIPPKYKQKQISEFLFGEKFVLDEEFVKKVITQEVEELEFRRNDLDKDFLIKFIIKKDIKKRTIQLFSFVHDITNDKKIQDKQKFSDSSLRTIFDAAKEAIFIIDRDFSLVDFNETAISYSDGQWGTKLIKGKDFFKTFPDLKKNEIKEFKKLFNNSFDGISHYLDRAFKLNGEHKYFKINVFPVFSGSKNNVSLVGVSWYDNTYEVELEKELEELRSEIKPLFDSSFQRFYLNDLQYRIIAFNKAAEETIFKEYNHVLKKGDSILNFVPKEMGIDDFREMFKKAMNYEHVSFKLKINSAIGEYWNEAHLEPILNAKGEITRILLWTIDVTEREKNIQALQESQERYSLIANGANDGLWDWDLRTNEIYLSSRWKNLLGYKENELLNKFGTHDRLIHPDDKERYEEELHKYLNGEIDIYAVEIRLRHKSGNYIWVLERGFAQRDKNGKPLRIAGSITDISEQKNIEEKLRNANKQLLEERKMFMEGDLLVYRLVVEGKTVTTKYITENIINILGYTNLNFTSGEMKFEDIIYPKDKMTLYNDLDRIRKQNKSNYEFSPIRFVKKDKSYVWIKNFATVINKKESSFELLGYCVDLSSLIDAKPMMNEKQKKIIEFFLNTSEPIVGIQKEKVIEVNKPARDLFGYSEEDFYGKTLSDIFYCEKEPVNSRFQRKLKERKQKLSYWKCIKHDKSFFDSEISLNPIEHDNGTIVYLIIRDISKRKKMEEKLRKSEALYKSLLDAIPDMFFVMNKQGKYLDYKADEKSPLFIDPQTIIGKSLHDFFDEETVKNILEKIHTAITENKVQTIFYTLPSNIGDRNYEARISKMDDTKILSIVRDITDQK